MRAIAAIRPRAYLAAIIAEIGRRDRLRQMVVAAGFVRVDDRKTKEWIPRSDVTAAVAEKLDAVVSPALGAEIGKLLAEDGWRTRKSSGIWQWRARRSVQVTTQQRAIK